MALGGVIMSHSDVEQPDRKKRAPRWATAPIEHTLKQGQRLDQLIHLTIQGISNLPARHKLVELFSRVEDGPENRIGPQQLEQAKREAELAAREIQDGFPILHAQAVLTLWALLEACIRRLVADWLVNDPGCLQRDPFNKIRVRVGEYERLGPQERAWFLVDALEREVASGEPAGVSRFEALLEALGLSGDVPDGLRRNLYELSQVRNVIAHRGGVVDKRFADSCPWFRVPAGNELTVSHELFAKYSHSVESYVGLLICRLGERFGVDMHDERAALLREYSRHADIENGDGVHRS